MPTTDADTINADILAFIRQLGAFKDESPRWCDAPMRTR